MAQLKLYTVEVYNFTSPSLSDWSQKLAGTYEIEAKSTTDLFRRTSSQFPNAARVKIINERKPNPTRFKTVDEAIAEGLIPAKRPEATDASGEAPNA